MHSINAMKGQRCGEAEHTPTSVYFDTPVTHLFSTYHHINAYVATDILGFSALPELIALS